MPSDVQKLMEVQDADRHILRLKEEIASLPKKVAAIEQKLAGTKAVLENAKTAVKADEAARRKYEATIQDLQGKISKYRDQSLGVKTNEQYKALLTEIQFAEQEIRAQEDKILELMVNAEARRKEVKAAEPNSRPKWPRSKKKKPTPASAPPKTKKNSPNGPPGANNCAPAWIRILLRHFERVAKFRGSGISEVRDQKCMACQVMLRPQTYNEVKSGKVIECESCQRILFFDPAKEVAAAPSNCAPSPPPRPPQVRRSPSLVLSPQLSRARRSLPGLQQ